MSPPKKSTPPPDSGLRLSRRSLLIGTGVAAGAAVIGIDLVSPTAANAAIVWGHPFTFRGTLGDYFGAPRGNNRTHEGQDYPAAQGTPIHAVADGTVIVSSEDYYGYGVAMVIDHGGGYTSTYGHMVFGSRRFGVGTNITRGTWIGDVGNTGNSYGAHLHIEIRINGTPVDPVPYVHNAPLAGTTPTIVLEDNMIKISSPTRGSALVGPGYFRQLTTQEEIDNAGPLISASQWGNDRQFDLWKSMAIGGQSA